MKDYKLKKGLIKSIKMKGSDDTKLKIKPAQISYMYLAASDLAKINSTFKQAFSVDNWKRSTTMDTSLLNKGYVYFEKVAIKKGDNKKYDLMFQMINTSFSDKIKVYLDPCAKETASISVSYVKVAGGLAKSYYVKKDSEDVAYRLFKRNYDKDFAKLFGDCPEMMNKYPKAKDWEDFEKHVYEYAALMSK